MPKDKKASSKTARVLGLLTSPTPTETEPEPAEKPAPKPPQPADDKVVEAELRGALELELQALEEELPPSKRRRAPPAPEPETETAEPSGEQPVPEPELSSQPVYQPAPRVPEPAPEPKAKGKSKAKADPPKIPTPKHPETHMEPEIFCFNVTQALVESKVDKYIDLFGLCTCPRCRIDVIALALSNLPPKYVVAREHEMVPLLSVYEGKYNAAIVSQVMNACKLVMEHPRHEKTV